MKKLIEKFESAHTRESFEYDFKMFSKSLDNILPRKEAEKYIDDFKYLSKKMFLIRNKYEGPSKSLKEYGSNVQQLIDDYIRSLKVTGLVELTEVSHENFINFVKGVKSENAKKALVKNRARQIIREFAPNNPAYYEKLKEKFLLR